jgi:SAM-dependent methyltransferase/uncharacterized protein YndB with AHSA1/START domain
MGTEAETTTVRAEIVVALDPSEAFDLAVDEFAGALERLGLRFEPGAQGRVLEEDSEVGRVVAWEPGERIVLEWRSGQWETVEATEVEVSFEPVQPGTRVAIEHRGWGGPLGGAREVLGWFASQVAAPLLQVTAPAAFGDWFTDRHARRPSGRQARDVYRDPLFHRPNFAVLLDLLALEPDDVLLEVGCGGGAFLRDALRSGCRAAAVDHSPDMVRLAREVNAEALAQGRLEIVEADADRLPFPDEMFTCATMTGVLGFLADPAAALAETRRVLVDGGRLVLLGSDPAWRGTPAAPEPMASRLRFYEDDELVRMGQEAAFTDVRVERHDLEKPAREAGIPEEYLPLFALARAPFLVARKA